MVQLRSPGRSATIAGRGTRIVEQSQAMILVSQRKEQAGITCLRILLDSVIGWQAQVKSEHLAIESGLREYVCRPQSYMRQSLHFNLLNLLIAHNGTLLKYRDAGDGNPLPEREGPGPGAGNPRQNLFPRYVRRRRCDKRGESGNTPAPPVKGYRP